MPPIPVTVVLSPCNSDITRFRPLSTIATGNHLDRVEKNSKLTQTTGTVVVFDPRSGISGPTSRRASACPNLQEWWTQPPAREMPSCSAIDLAEIRQSSRISSWIWSIISGVVTVLDRPGRGASQVEKSPRFNWATQFLTVAYDGACSPNVPVRIAWNYFGAVPCRKKNLMTASPCCWNRARRLTCFLSASVNKKRLAIRHMNRPLFPTTLSIPSYDIG